VRRSPGNQENIQHWIEGKKLMPGNMKLNQGKREFIFYPGINTILDTNAVDWKLYIERIHSEFASAGNYIQIQNAWFY
jgi:hypothetical protein